MALYYFINTGRGNKAFIYAAKLSGKEREDFYVSLSRGFKPGENFINRFRQNPCAPLLYFIHQRLLSFDYKEYDDNMRKYHVIHYKFYNFIDCGRCFYESRNICSRIQN
jgi:hypothetical protein